MKEFANLNLNREKLLHAIKDCVGLECVPSLMEKGAAHHCSLNYEGTQFLLIFYFRKDGTTTINVNGGPNPSLSYQFAACIKDKCLIHEKKSIDVSFKGIIEDHFNLLCDYLSSDVGAKITDNKTEKNSKMLVFSGPYNDKLTTKYYSNQTLQFQGKPLHVYSEAKSFIYELLSYEDIIEKESEAFEIAIKPSEIRDELKAYLPNAYEYLEERTKKIISPALVYKKIEVELEDYSSFVFPVLRGLEGVIRQAFINKGKTAMIKNVGKIGTLFDDKTDKLLDFARTEIGSEICCDKICECYNFWKSKRHPLFHVGKDIDRAPIIWKKENADALIIEALELINKSAILITPE